MCKRHGGEIATGQVFRGNFSSLSVYLTHGFHICKILTFISHHGKIFLWIIALFSLDYCFKDIWAVEKKRILFSWRQVSFFFSWHIFQVMLILFEKLKLQGFRHFF